MSKPRKKTARTTTTRTVTTQTFSAADLIEALRRVNMIPLEGVVAFKNPACSCSEEGHVYDLEVETSDEQTVHE